jgi:hypothetical protein
VLTVLTLVLFVSKIATVVPTPSPVPEWVTVPEIVAPAWSAKLTTEVLDVDTATRLPSVTVHVLAGHAMLLYS